MNRLSITKNRNTQVKQNSKTIYISILKLQFSLLLQQQRQQQQQTLLLPPQYTYIVTRYLKYKNKEIVT